MKQCGWSFLRRKRRSREYVYAARKDQNRRIERYICPLAKLAELSRNSLIVKLNRNMLSTSVETAGVGSKLSNNSKQEA